MTTKSKSCFGPRRGYDFPEYYAREDMITDRQRRVLTNYIQTLQDEHERERMLSELDEMSCDEADDMIFQVSKWQ